VIGPRASRSSCRSARTACTGARSTASRPTGSTRRTRVRARGAREGRRQQQGRALQRHGLAAPAARLAEGDGGPGGVPRVAALRPVSRRGLRLHPQGRRHRAAGRLHTGRLRVRRAHRGGAPLHRARVNGRLVPLESRLENGDLVEVFTSKAATAAPSRDWLAFVASPRPATRSASGSRRAAARRPSRTARTPSPAPCASRACRCSGCCPASR
jgi:hypothetical protein